MLTSPSRRETGDNDDRKFQTDVRMLPQFGPLEDPPADNTGSFNLQRCAGVRQGIAWKWRHLLQRSDGYKYSTTQGGASSPCLKAGVSAPMMS